MSSTTTQGRVPDGEGAATLHHFDADIALEPLGEGRYGAQMRERWWVGRGPNGGYVAAVVLAAIMEAGGGERAPRSLTVQYPRPPQAGPAEIAVTVEREGRSATFLSARLEQQGQVQATALATLATAWDAPDYAEAKMPDAAAPDELHAIDPAAAPDLPAMLQNYRMAPALGEEAFSGGAPLSGAWLRTREPRLLDAPLAAAFLDAWFPTPYVRLKRPLPAPTIDYTVHFRAPLPPPQARAEDPYLAVFRSRLAREGFFDEDGELWSADGTLLAQSRQLGLLLADGGG